MIKETVYLGHDNAIDLVLRDGRTAVDLSGATRVVLRDLECVAILDSETSPTAFYWGEGGGKLTLRLGQEPVPAGTYTYHVIVYDPANTDGVVWDRIRLSFEALCVV